jgi:hypothetical protein
MRFNHLQNAAGESKGATVKFRAVFVRNGALDVFIAIILVEQLRGLPQ